MFKRAYLSAIRRKTKTIVMFLFLFVVSTLALCSIAIKNATNLSMDIAKKSLGGEVTLSADMTKLRDDFMNKESSEINFSEESGAEDRKRQKKDMHDKMHKSNATIQDVNKISKIKYVSDVKYSFSVSATESSFELYEQDDEINENEEMRMPKMGNSNNLQVTVINTFNLEEDYVNKKIDLVEGESFDENDENVVIISYELATHNDFNISDEITLLDEDNEEYKLKIIGIYQNSSNDKFNSNYNKIYIDINSGEKLLSDESYNDGNYKISSAVFYLNDPEKVDEFKEKANKLVTDLEDRYLKLDIDTQVYDKMVSSIQGVKNFSNVILIVVVSASIVIISLMVVNSLKERNYELGVLLSLGEKKIKIIGQFILELLLIAIMSFALATFTSNLIGQKLGDAVISMQTKVEESSDEFGGRGNGFTSNKMSKPDKNGNLDVEVIDTIDVNISIQNILMMILIELIIIVFSMLLPSIKILNSDPKDILSRRD